MEYIEDYKGIKIYKSNGFFTTSPNGIDVSDINFLKRMINLNK